MDQRVACVRKGGRGCTTESRDAVAVAVVVVAQHHVRHKCLWQDPLHWRVWHKKGWNQCNVHPIDMPRVVHHERRLCALKAMCVCC